MNRKKYQLGNHKYYLPQIITIFFRTLLLSSPLFLLPFFSPAQQKDSSLQKVAIETIKKDSLKQTQITEVKGRITDSVTGSPVVFVRVSFIDGKSGTNSNEQGNYDLSAKGLYKQIKFSFVGYKTIVKSIVPGAVMNIKLVPEKIELKEVVIKSAKRKRYKNKDNPAVELIQLVIDHKSQNRIEDADYIQYDQYERIIMSLVDLSPSFLNGNFFRKYRFLLDTTEVVNGKNNSTLPIYMSEKLSQYYYRKVPKKSITIMGAHKEADFNAVIDQKGFDIYLNRLYGQVDLYENNIFIVTNQFLSPIADHAPDFYKFFISDTVQSGNQKLIEISFVPRNRGDLLFEGKLYITMDGNYAVKAADLKIDKQINLNFLRLLKIHQDFDKSANGRYYLVKSDVKADFGILKNKGFGFSGDRTVFYNNYKLHTPLQPSFYNGSSTQTITDTNQAKTDFWQKNRTDTLTGQQAKLYSNIDSLEKMPSFKRTVWITRTLIGSYGELGPLQVGPIDAFFSFNSIEGTRVLLGGRTTPLFNKTVYLEGYSAYGSKDHRFKYMPTAYFSFNQTAPYLFPNNYLKISYQYDTDVPGTDFLIAKTQSLLGSFQRGTSDFWLYNKIFRLNYVRDFENHISFNLEFKNWEQQTAGTLVYQPVNPAYNPLPQITTTELRMLFRYAPNEKFLQGTVHRFTIPSKYPIFTLSANYGVKGIINSEYNYLNLSANIYKRFYLSQLGFTDVTLLGGTVLGQVPFPLLAILPANQTYLYDKNAYNMMNFLEFVSDHYAGINITHYFEGFFLNKIPVVESFKLREIVSFKLLYGGLRNENNPILNNNGLFKFPTYPNGNPATYALGNTPYVEAGAGIGNIYKILRIDFIHRFNYLNHEGVTPWGLRFSLTPDL